MGVLPRFSPRPAERDHPGPDVHPEEGAGQGQRMDDSHGGQDIAVGFLQKSMKSVALANNNITNANVFLF